MFSHFAGRLVIAALLSLILTANADGQAIVKANCLVPYEIEFSNKSEVSSRDTRIRFVDHDDHTFWYKLTFAEGGKWSYAFTSLDKQNNFDIYFYQYDGNNFCRSFIQENLDLITIERNLVTKVGKGETYYLGVYPLFPGGCGHRFDFTLNGINYSLEVQDDKSKCVDEEKIVNPVSTADKGTLNVKGIVRDKRSGKAVYARVQLMDPFTNHEVEVLSDDATGFEAGLYQDGDYKVKIIAFGYKELISALPAYEGELYNFRLDPSDQGRYILNNVYFYPNTYALKDESIPELESIYSFLKNNQASSIEIIGHTNGDKDVKASRITEKKGDEWNFSGTAKELSLRRSKVIGDFLTSKGIDPIRINAMGKGGEEMVVADPQNMREAMKNIRVEVVVLK